MSTTRSTPILLAAVRRSHALVSADDLATRIRPGARCSSRRNAIASGTTSATCASTLPALTTYCILPVLVGTPHAEVPICAGSPARPGDVLCACSVRVTEAPIGRFGAPDGVDVAS